MAAQISESDLNERLANKEESEKERPEEQAPRMGFFSLLTIQSALFALRYNVLTLVRMLSLKSLKKQMKRKNKCLNEKRTHAEGAWGAVPRVIT